MRFAPGATRYAGIAAALAVVGAIVAPWLSLAAVAGGAFAIWFFRDPDRTPPESGVVAPADGRVSVLREEGDRIRVGVFMNVWNVHVNRAPASGVVRSVEHTSGAHRPAFSKDSDRNERVRIVLDDHEVVLIAGAFARRIVPYLDVDEHVERGQRIGHIAFGSRADVLLPPSVRRDHLQVARGDRVRAGETIVAVDP